MQPLISKQYPFSKVGVDEVVGLKPLLHSLMRPVLSHIQDSVYWSTLELSDSEYTSRDGFIPHSHNCGGVELVTVLPKCEADSYGYLSFGECDECAKLDDGYCGYQGQECVSEGDGHLDAKFRVWLKFEGINADGEMEFYLYAGGGNADAPYFRTKYEPTIYEASFSVRTLAQLKTMGRLEIVKMLKALKEAS